MEFLLSQGEVSRMSEAVKINVVFQNNGKSKIFLLVPAP
jgi:hypothetical protein